MVSARTCRHGYLPCVRYVLLAVGGMCCWLRVLCAVGCGQRHMFSVVVPERVGLCARLVVLMWRWSCCCHGCCCRCSHVYLLAWDARARALACVYVRVCACVCVCDMDVTWG